MTKPATAAAAANADELTCEVAAKLLHVSRAYFDMLVATGQLANVSRTPGDDSRISMSEVLDYKAASKKRRAKGLRAMAKATERLGIYDLELDGVSIRIRR